MRALVTAGAGFIGSGLVHRLAVAGGNVTVLGGLSAGSPRRPDGAAAALRWGDGRDAAGVGEAVRGRGAILHCAAVVAVPRTIWRRRDGLTTNAPGTVNAPRAAHEAGAPVTLASVPLRRESTPGEISRPRRRRGCGRAGRRTWRPHARRARPVKQDETGRETHAGAGQDAPDGGTAPASERARPAAPREPEAVGVVGVGHIGLALALALVGTGMTVHGYDADAERIGALRAGRSGVATAEDESVRRAVAAGRLRPTSDPQDLAGCGAVAICVPSPLGAGGAPDATAIASASEMVAGVARPGTLVVLESTGYPGTTRELVLPPLRRRLGEPGAGCFLAAVPERLDPGNPHYGLGNTPRVVGGVTAACCRRAMALYGHIVPHCHPVSSPEVAETAKLLENAFRNINIAHVNELMGFCDRLGLDVDEVVDAAATKPFGFMAFRPGPGVGGECIPVDPRYLAWRARQARTPLRLLEQAMDINDAMPGHAAERIAWWLHREGAALAGADVLLLGVSYKAGTGDVRNAPALAIAAHLAGAGARVRYHDPFVPRVCLAGEMVESMPLTDGLLAEADAVVLVTPHPGFDPRDLGRRSRRFLDLTHGTAPETRR